MTLFCYHHKVYKEFLDIIHDLKSIPEFNQELDNILQNHQKTINHPIIQFHYNLIKQQIHHKINYHAFHPKISNHKCKQISTHHLPKNCYQKLILTKKPWIPLCRIIFSRILASSNKKPKSIPVKIRPTLEIQIYKLPMVSR